MFRRTTTDVILYGIAASRFEALVPRYPDVKRYVTAHASVSGIIGFGRTSWLDAEPPPLDFLRARHSSARLCSGSIAAPLSIRTAVREMLIRRTEALAVTADGEPGAILTASELGLFCGHNPVRLVHEIRHASALAELRPLLRLATRLVLEALAQPLDVDDCCRIGTEVVVAAAEACIRLAGADILAARIDPAAAPFCWVMFGKSARETC